MHIYIYNFFTYLLQILSEVEQEAEVLHPCQEEDRTLYNPRSTQASQCSIPGAKLFKLFSPSKEQHILDTCGLYYKHVTIVIDAPSVVKVMLQIVASLMIVIDDAS